MAPYNPQVSALARTLPAGARVGTVDNFQGQEAAVQAAMPPFNGTVTAQSQI